MDWRSLCEEAERNYGKEAPLASGKLLSFLLDRDSLRTRLLGFMTKAYWSRKRLLKEGKVAYGYAFREWSFGERALEHPVWIVHSPSLKALEHPEILKKAADLLMKRDCWPLISKKESDLLARSFEPLARPMFLPLPENFGEVPLFLSVLDWIPRQLHELRLGLNLIVQNPAVSKETLLLMERYFPQAWRDAYFGQGIAL